MINALSPLDGRYRSRVKDLAMVFSEAGLIRARIAVEVEWLIFLVNELQLNETKPLTKEQVDHLKRLYVDFKEDFAKEVKDIEKTTNHDVKAVEYFLGKALKVLKREDLIPFVHFGCTSEDINNLAYGKMLKIALEKIMQPTIAQLLKQLKEYSEDFKDVPMMSHTHGQPASPTTVGKEFKNIGARLFRQAEQLKKTQMLGKMNGATGNFNAHVVAYPEVDWVAASRKFVEHMGLHWQRYTTQIEPHDYLAEVFDVLRRINVILIDLDRDMWSYISRGYFKQRLVKGEVGSSTMPHKVNPIDFENSEGNLGMANAMLSHMAEKLPMSRMQRDLTDSTVLRNIGSAFGYSILGYKAAMKGLGKLDINEAAMSEDLDKNWALLAEPIQMLMRRYGIPNAYEQLKELTRGSTIDKKRIQDFVQGLDLPEDAKKRLLELSPSTYIGLAKTL